MPGGDPVLCAPLRSVLDTPQQNGNRLYGATSVQRKRKQRHLHRLKKIMRYMENVYHGNICFARVQRCDLLLKWQYAINLRGNRIKTMKPSFENDAEPQLRKIHCVALYFTIQLCSFLYASYIMYHTSSFVVIHSIP